MWGSDGVYSDVGNLFHQLNAVAKKRMESRSSAAQQPTTTCDAAVIVMCLVSWFMCHAAQLRLLSMASIDPTWQAYLLPCFQRLYRAAWCPGSFGEAADRWAYVTAFAGQVTQEGDALYVVMCGTLVLGAFSPMVEVFLPGPDWLLPQLFSSIASFFLMVYLIRSGVEVSE
ncbi:unnamed protein product, partial [Symbiodinium necroappetens]